MENGVTPETAGSTENKAMEENGVIEKTKSESPAILPEKPRRGRPRKKVIENNGSADHGKTKNDEQTNCNGTSARSSLRTDNQKLVAVKTEIKKEIDEDQEYSAAFLCDTNLHETNGIKVRLQIFDFESLVLQKKTLTLSKNLNINIFDIDHFLKFLK